MSGSERMAAIRAKTLQNLNLSQEEMSIYGAEVKEKYENAMKIGNITCAYRKVMFLGDSGVGKTSSRKLLMGIPHSERDGESTFGIEQYFVDGSYKKIDNSRYTEVQQAASYFTILGTSNLLTHIATPIYILLLNGVILMVTFFITGIITFILLCLHGIRLGFTPLLLLAVVPVSILWKNDIEGFNQGNGLAIILVILNYISTIMLPEMCSGIRTMEKYDALWAILSRTFISSGVFALLSASLGTGGRAGMAVALCTLIPPAYKGIVTQLAQTHSFNLKSGENEIMNILQIIFLFLSFVLGVLIQSKFHNMKRRILICVCSLTSALTMLVMMVSMKIESELLLATCTGVIYGFSFVRGLTFGHRLRRLFGHSRLLVIVYGWEVGMLGGIYMGWRFSWTALFTDGWYLFLAILGCTIAIASEIRRHYLIRNDSVPAQLIWDIKCSNPTTWPQRLCLLDCSGNELYHVGHHIFMAKHSIYLVVFSLEDAYERPDWQMERILYWLNSVFAHAHHRDSLIFLIGTHRASLDNNQTNGIASMMKRELYPVFGGRLALNSSRNECPLFTLENRYRECNGWDTDIDELKEMILKTTREAEYANRLIPVKWLGFLDYVKTIRRNYRRDCIVSYFDLWSKMKEDIGFEKEAHFLRMLEFFNDYGEIFFKSNDPRLFRYVLLEPQILADCVESLAGNYLTVVPKHLESAWNSLCRTGVTSPALLRFMLQNTVGDLDCILDILRAVNLIIPFSTESEEMFIVPYRLPLSVNESVLPFFPHTAVH
ncbi:uncharacterized protein LOC141901616 isoform X2 [Tubulanus polymorphus]|uniref:uncharacterized protein LOC141901616 isoform X2 n=1 Tax=Tubulanus polymorphus TaxID=672921 RepID=UPI003DA3B1ED